jgi:hypothetical protein
VYIIERVVGNAIILDVRGRLYGVDAGCRLERTVERLGRRPVARPDDIRFA